MSARGASACPVFDPQRLAEGLPAGMRWSPVRGCEDPLTAMIRANGLAAATGLSAGGVESGGFWEGKTRTALQSLLHAAALDGRQPAELFRWTLDPSAASEAVAIPTGVQIAGRSYDDVTVFRIGAALDAAELAERARKRAQKKTGPNRT